MDRTTACQSNKSNLDTLQSPWTDAFSGPTDVRRRLWLKSDEFVCVEGWGQGEIEIYEYFYVLMFWPRPLHFVKF